MSVGSTVLACGMRPNVGFNALTPQHCAGWRSDPRPSFPRPNGLMPVAMAALAGARGAGVRELSQGSFGTPKLALAVPANGAARKVCAANRDPPGGLQALNDRSVSTGISAASALNPCVVGVPATSMFSFTVKGTPWNGPRTAPAATARSAVFAASAPARPSQ